MDGRKGLMTELQKRPLPVRIRRPADGIPMNDLFRSATSPTEPLPTTPTLPTPTRRTEAVADFNTCARPEYPRSSQRNEETGTTTLQFLIGVDGRVMEAKLAKSSGFRDLDRAAQSALSKCRFKPAMIDGKPEQAWTAVQYVWTLE